MSIIPINAQTIKLPAFPGAEGGGMYSQGARAADDFEIYHVTNLDDSGEGSFRDAVSKGNRMIIFDVAGNIMLKTDLIIRTSNLTLLGQTAPGEGICVGGESVRFIGSNNVIMRYMRFRMGENSTSQEDGLGLRKCTDVIVDHCSVEWSVDECLSAYENKNFTAQYCIISESLNNSGHDKGAHGYGGIWGGINASFHHNLVSTHKARMPRIGSSATVSSYNGQPDTDSLIDIRNNVFYNYRSTIGYGGENGTRVNFVNNYYRPSQFSSQNPKFYTPYSGSNGGTTIFADGNYMENNDTFNADNKKGISVSAKTTVCENISDGIEVDGVFKRNDEYIYDYPVTTVTAQAAYDDVLNNAGNCLVRDYTDTRIINDVINKTTPQGSRGSEGLIDSQEDVGGWNGLYGVKEQDSDTDGIPDAWEDAHGLDKADPNDSAKISLTGYTNLEDYANDIVKTTYNSTDKAALWETAEKVRALDGEEYFADTYSAVSAAFDAAKAVLADRNSGQDEIDSACEALNKALDGLKVDHRKYLNTAIEKADNIQKEIYVNEDYNTLTKLADEGRKILAASYDESNIVSQTEKINTALDSLKVSGRVSLGKTVERYENYENDDWTSESFDAFINTLVYKCFKV